MKTNNGLKRTLAGVLSLALVSGMMPGEFGEVFDLRTNIVHADPTDTDSSESISLMSPVLKMVGGEFGPTGSGGVDQNVVLSNYYESLRSSDYLNIGARLCDSEAAGWKYRIDGGEEQEIGDGFTADKIYFVSKTDKTNKIVDLITAGEKVNEVEAEDVEIGTYILSRMGSLSDGVDGKITCAEGNWKYKIDGSTEDAKSITNNAPFVAKFVEGNDSNYAVGYKVVGKDDEDRIITLKEYKNDSSRDKLIATEDFKNKFKFTAPSNDPSCLRHAIIQLKNEDETLCSPLETELMIGHYDYCYDGSENIPLSGGSHTFYVSHNEDSGLLYGQCDTESNGIYGVGPWEFTLTDYSTKTEVTANDFSFTRPENLEYDGLEKPQGLTTELDGITSDNFAEHFEVAYKYKAASADTFGSWSTDAPKNAGIYKIGVKVIDGDTSYKMPETGLEDGYLVLEDNDAWTFTIAQKSIANAVSKVDDLKYIEKENESVDNTQSLIVVNESYSLVPSKIHFSVEYKAPSAEDFTNFSSWSNDVPKAREAGTYKVKWYYEDASNFTGCGTQDAPNVIETSIAQLPATITTAPEIMDSYPYEDGTDIYFVVNAPKSNEGKVEYEIKTGNGEYSKVPEDKTPNAKGVAGETTEYTIRYRAAGDNANYGPSEWVEKSTKIEPIFQNANVNAFNANGGTLTLTINGTYGNVVITHGGVIDLNGSRITRLYLRNPANQTVTIMNGTISEIDDWGGTTNNRIGNVILAGVSVGTAYAGPRTIYTIGSSITRPVPENGSFNNQDSNGYNAIGDPVSKIGLVYNGGNQCLLDTSQMKGTFGFNNSDSYFTYYYSRKSEDGFTVGTTKNGVLNQDCAPIYEKHAGTYNVYYQWDCDSTSSGASGTGKWFTVSIATAENSWITEPAAATGLKYSGSDLALVGNSPKSSFGTIEYSLDNETWSTDVPKVKDAGTYTVYYRVPVDSEYPNDYKGIAAESFSVTVEAAFDLQDDHTNDPLVAKSDQVRKTITKIEYDSNGNNETDEDETVTFSDSSAVAKYHYIQNRTIKVYSTAELEFTVNDTDDKLTGVKGSYDNSGCVYTFKIPEGVSIVKAKRKYNYNLNTIHDPEESGTLTNVLVGQDNALHPEKPEYSVAKLYADDHEYLDNFDAKVRVDENENFELAKSSEYVYAKYLTEDAADDSQVEAVTGKPSAIGLYKVKAGLTIPANDQTYWLENSFRITPRNYLNHSGTLATTDNEIKATITFGETNTVTYNGEVQTPVVTIRDTILSKNPDEQLLVRGKDYDLGYLDENNKFVTVNPEDDATRLGKTDAGTYSVYVCFKGNYTYKSQDEEKYLPVEWKIAKADIAKDDVNAPAAAEGLTYNTKAQDLISVPESGVTKCGTVWYKLDGGEWTKSVPSATNANNYGVSWYIEGDKNHNNYGSQGEPAGLINAEIARKTVDPEVVLSKQTFIYDGNAHQFTEIKVMDGTTLIPEAEYTVEYYQNTDAGSKTAYVIIEDNTTVDSKNYTITKKEVPFTIEQAEPKLTVTANNIVYDGEPVNETDFTVTKLGINDNPLENGTVVLSYYEDNNGKKGSKLTEAPKNAGKYWVVADMEAYGNYKAQKDEKLFEIAPKSIDSESITISASYAVADGKTGQKPGTFTVMDGDTELTEGKDYTVAYTNNINSGTGTAKVTGKGNYQNLKTADFEVRSTLDLSAVDKKDITSIVIGDDDVVESNDTGIYYVKTNTDIRIVTNSKFKFEDGTVTELSTNNTSEGFKYSFRIPDGVNRAAVTHVYDYKTSQVIDDINDTVTVKGVDMNVKNNDVPVDILKITIDPVYYLDDFTDKVTIEDMKAPGVTYQLLSQIYTISPDDHSNTAQLVNGKPFGAGKYNVEFKIRVSYSDKYEDIQIDKQFDVRRREYNASEMKVALDHDVFEFNGQNKSVEVTVTDSKLPEGKQTLVRGKDYELGYLDNKEFIVIDSEKDAEDSGHLNAADPGTYKIAVKFIGNYSGLAEKTWVITEKRIAQFTIKPDEKLIYNGKTHPVTLETADGTVIPDDVVIIKYYKKGSSVELDDAPVNAGTYAVKVSVDNENAVNYILAENQVTELDFTVNPKPVTSEDIKIDYPRATLYNTDPEKWDGDTKCEGIVVKDGDAELERGVDYVVGRDTAYFPETDLKIQIKGKGNYIGSCSIPWDVVEASSAISNYEVADDKGRIRFYCENTELNYENVQYGVLIYRDGVYDGDMVVGAAGVTDSVRSAANDSFLVRDIGNGVYVRPYIKIGSDYVYGEQVFVVNDKLKAMEEAKSEIVKGELSGTADKLRIYCRSTELDYENVQYGVLIYRDGVLDTDMEAGNTEFDFTDSLRTASDSFLVRDLGNGVYVRPYTKVDDKYIYGEQKYYNYNELLNTKALAEAKSEITDFQVADTAGRIRISYNNTYIGTEEHKYGVLIYRDGELNGDMVVGSAGVTNAERTSATDSFLVKDIGKGVYVRPYIVIGDTYKYGEQKYVKHNTLLNEEAFSNAESKIVKTEEADEEGRIRFYYANKYEGTENYQYGVLIYRDGALTSDMTVGTPNVTNSIRTSATDSFLVKDIGNGVYVRPYIKIGETYKYGIQWRVEHSKFMKN